MSDKNDAEKGSCCSLCGSVSEKESTVSQCTTGSSSSSTSSSLSDLDDEEHEIGEDEEEEEEDNQSVLEWINENCDESGNLFYLKSLEKENPPNEEINNVSTIPDFDNERVNPFLKMQKFRSSYFKLAHWMLQKRKGSIKKPNMAKKTKKKMGEKKVGSKMKKRGKDEEREEQSFSQASDGLQRLGIQISGVPDNLLELVRNEDRRNPGATVSNNSSSSSKIYENRFVLLYITHPSDTSNVIFGYPGEKDDSESSGKFEEEVAVVKKLTGMFSTLSHVVNEITGQLPLVSKIKVHPTSKSGQYKEVHQHSNQDSLVEGTNVDEDPVYNVAYTQEFNSILAVGLPDDSFSEIEIKSLSVAVTRLVRYLYNSLDGAFRNGNHAAEIQHLLDILSYQLFSEQEASSNLCFYFNVAQKMMLSDELALNLDEIINGYESMDWINDSEFFENGNRSSAADFIVIGSCLFYKSLLICSHLNSDYLTDVISFIKFRGILPLMRSHPLKLVIWREVFPTTTYKTSGSLDSEYTENEGSRYFLLVVGVEYSLFCVLLEMPFLTAESRIKPEETIIHQAIKFVASSLNRSGILEEIEHCLNMQSTIFTQSAFEESNHGSKSFVRSLSLRDLVTTSIKTQDSLSSTNLQPFTSFHSGSGKSLSTPSLQTSLSTKTTTESNTSICSSEYNASRVLTNTCTSESSCPQSCSSFFESYFDDLKGWLPSNLVIFVDINHKEKTFFGSIFDESLNFKTSSLCRKFKETCVYISGQLRSLHPTVTELGSNIFIKQSTSCRRPRYKKQEDYEDEVFWVVGRLESMDREIFSCFRVSADPRQISLDFDMNNFCYSLSLQNKLR